MPTAFKCTRIKQTPYKNIKWQWRRGLLKSVLWAYSNPKWPVEWVANWSMIPRSASTREQNRPPNIPPGGRGTPLDLFSGYRAPLHYNAL